MTIQTPNNLWACANVLRDDTGPNETAQLENSDNLRNLGFVPNSQGRITLELVQAIAPDAAICQSIPHYEIGSPNFCYVSPAIAPFADADLDGLPDGLLVAAMAGGSGTITRHSLSVFQLSPTAPGPIVPIVAVP